MNQIAPPFGSIASMTTCSVLRCPETPTSVFKLMPGSNLEVPVCTGHKESLEGGAHWMVHGGTGLPPEKVPKSIQDSAFSWARISRTATG